MTNSKKRKPTRPPIVKAVAKKTLSVSERRISKASGAPAKVLKAAVLAPVPVDTLHALTADVAAVKARLLKEHESLPLGSGEEYDALRRLVNDLLERRMERVVRELVDIRNAAGAVAGGATVVEALEALLERMGAVRFEGQRLDHVDPLIHAVSRETHDPSVADGAITASLRAGYRTVRGVILAKAQVAVNRRI